MSTIKKVCLFLATLSLPFSVYASNDFFEVGKTYIFVPRINLVMKGKVVQITDQEIVFTDRYVLKASKPAMATPNEGKAFGVKNAAIVAYLNSKDKASLLEASRLKDVPVSFSRSEMTAIKLDE